MNLILRLVRATSVRVRGFVRNVTSPRRRAARRQLLDALTVEPRARRR